MKSGNDPGAGVPAKVAVTPAGAPPALGPYSHAVVSGGFLFCSGQVPIDPARPGAPFPNDIREQTRVVLENVRRLLETRSLDFGAVVKTTVFLTDLADFPAMNEVYAGFFPAPHPARSTVQVAALPKGAAIEIEVIARCG